MNGQGLAEKGGFRVDLRSHVRRVEGDAGPRTDAADVDALIVGAGFCG